MTILYAGTDIGVYQSRDGGATWNPFGQGLPRVAVFDMAIQNVKRVLRIATHGRGMWETALNPLDIATAVSRKTHTGVGDFDIPLALSGPATTEPRSGGASNNFTIVFTFTNPLAAVDEATVSCGSVSSRLVDPSNTRRYIVNLTGVVCNSHDIGITLVGVHDTLGSTLANTTVAMGLLRGDTNNDRFVNAGDALQTRSRAGQAADATNFRSDVNTDGFINSGDTLIVRAASGTTIGP